MTSVYARQIFWLRQLTAVSREEIQVMATPKTSWIPFSSVLLNSPSKTLHSRTILKNELVLEIDNDNWEIVRDGTRKVIETLKRWGGNDAYYLSYSGNRSIHVHVFMSLTGVEIPPDIAKLLEGQTDVMATVKAYWTRQFAMATGANLDMQLTGKHLIRMEGGFNEKSGKYCTQIYEIPDEKPNFYDIVIPQSIPFKPWDVAPFTRAIQAMLKVHYAPKPVKIYSPGKPFNIDPLVEILKPVYITGHRHFMVSALAGWLKRHSIPENETLRIVRALNPRDATPSATTATVKSIYNALDGDKIPGFHKLERIIDDEFLAGEITLQAANQVKHALSSVACIPEFPLGEIEGKEVH